MKKTLLVLAILAICSPAYAQLGGIGGAMKKAQQAQDTKKKLDDLNFTDDEEQTIGADVSAKIRAALRRRAGSGRAQVRHARRARRWPKQSDRPDLPWTFIVLDTDGVNAFASPGGFVHITRGALGLIKNEAELAGVLGHEIGHVVRKHTINAHPEEQAVKMGTSAASDRVALPVNRRQRRLRHRARERFDRGDELDADRLGVELPQKAGYAARGARRRSCTRLDERNKDQAEKNGLFASHPETKERIDKIAALAASGQDHRDGGGTLQANIKYRAGAHHRDRRGRRRRLGPHRLLEAGRQEGRAQEEGFRPGRPEADRRAGKTEHAGVGVGRRPRSRRRSRRQRRQQPGIVKTSGDGGGTGRRSSRGIVKSASTSDARDRQEGAQRSSVDVAANLRLSTVPTSIAAVTYRRECPSRLP